MKTTARDNYLMNTLPIRLKALREQRTPKLSQRALGEACGWDSKSAQARIGNYENGSREPNLSDLEKLARALNTSIAYLVGESDTPRTGEESGAYTVIPQYTAKGSAGPGYENDHVEVKGGLVFKRDWLKRMGLKAENLRVIYASGTSMEPTIADGDVLLIDESQTNPANGKIYAISRPDGDISIKRLIRQLTGGWLIRSDNANKAAYPDEPATDSEIGHISVIGRVVWHGGAL